MKIRVHNVAIQTGRFEESYKFYSEIVGLPVLREPFVYKGQRSLAWFDGGGVLVELYSVKYGTEASRHDPSGVGPDHVAFEVEDLESVLERLSEHGYNPTKPPFTPPSGDPFQPRVMFILGPDGEEVQFREPHRGGSTD